jgi:ribosomal protein S18 acetylase RimI-like enzyme
MDGVRLADATPDDEPTLFALFSSVRSEELSMHGWDSTLKNTILRQQFDAQRRGHRSQYNTAREQLILAEGRPVGWALLDRSAPAWHCVDIAVCAEHRRRGIATEVLRTWQREAEAARCTITLAVLRTNPGARALYDGLRFAVVGQTETHWLMEWRPK